MAKKIKALIGFANADISMYVGEIKTVDNSVATPLISGGLAVEYTDPVTPSGSLSVGANGTYDVNTKASVVVECTTVTITYNANGGTGSVNAYTGVKGDTATLSDGTGLTPPSEKTFAGWGLTADATEAVGETLSLTEDITLYAIYE